MALNINFVLMPFEYNLDQEEAEALRVYLESFTPGTLPLGRLTTLIGVLQSIRWNQHHEIIPLNLPSDIAHEFYRVAIDAKKTPMTLIQFCGALKDYVREDLAERGKQK